MVERIGAHALGFLYQGEYSRLRLTRHYGCTSASRVIGSGYIRAEETLAPMSVPTLWSTLMQVTPLIWLITIAVTILFFVYEFFAHVRKPHEPTIAESARWSAFYIGLALLFGVGIGVVSGWTFGGEYFAGYLTEKALSIDNLFVFLIVMAGFAVPKKYQQKVRYLRQ